MEFENDIFVSYAHIDNESPLEGQAGWVTTFHRALEVRVAQLLGRKPRIWRDPKLSGNDYFADRLVERLAGVGLVVSVLSPRYVNSEWCSRELREFGRAAEAGGSLRLGHRSRLFKVIKTPVPLSEHPAEVQDLLGYEFYAVDPQTGRAREFAQESGSGTERQYWAKLDDLAHDVSELLGLLSSGGGAAAPAAPQGEPVYLAETSFDLREARDGVRRQLQERGHLVLPDRQLPLVAPELEAYVRSELGRCRLSVHMVGANYGVVPEGATQSVVALQSQLALERGVGGDLTRLIWMPPGLEVDDQRQQRFLDLLRTDTGVQAGADLLETPLEDLKTALEGKLEALRAPEPEPEPAASAGDDLTRAYLICDQRDLGEVQNLEDRLFDSGLEVILPVFEGDEAQVRLDHQENLAACDAVLLYYGAGNELWLRRKLRELQKSPGYGRKRPFLARAIYVAPPPTPQKERLRTREAELIDARGGVSPDALDPFLTRIEAERRRLAG